MHVSPITQNRYSNINFQRKESPEARPASPVKNAAKALIIIPFMTPFLMTGCDKDRSFEFEKEYDHCYKDTTATDSSHQHIEARTIVLPVSALDIEG